MQMQLPPTWVLVVRARRLLVRPVARRLVALTVAAITGVTVTNVVRAAERQRDIWGERRSVAVATRELVPGETLDAGSVQMRELPEIALSAQALDEVPLGAVVRQPIAAGEPLVAERLAPDGLDGVAALVPAGHRAISIPVGPGGVPPVHIGDEVDLVAVLPTVADLSGHGHGDDEETASAAEPAFPLVEGAVVVDVADQALSVAVPQRDAPYIAYAVTNGMVLVALAGA